MSNILIADDQPCVRQLLSEELADEGHCVTSVGNAAGIQECLERSRPDLVVLDLHLDGPDGFHVLRDIKKQNPHLPVIIFTAYDGFANDPRLSRADAYVIKSLLALDELKQRIAEVMEHKVAAKPEVGAKRHFGRFGFAECR